MLFVTVTTRAQDPIISELTPSREHIPTPVNSELTEFKTESTRNKHTFTSVKYTIFTETIFTGIKYTCTSTLHKRKVPYTQSTFHHKMTVLYTCIVLSFTYFCQPQPFHIQIQCRITTIQVLQKEFPTHYKMNSNKKSLYVLFAFRYQHRMVSQPFNSINPPGETEAAAAAGVAAELVLAIGHVMPSMILVNTAVQQCIYRFVIAHVNTYTKSVQSIN